jgi:vacuolar-type H+-ATPase subunit H
MEKVWDELKKIEAQAGQIKLDAQTKSQEIILTAQKEAEKLITNSQTYAQEEAQTIYKKTTNQANQNRQTLLNENQKEAEKLQAQAEKQLPKAITIIVNGVLGENKI